jgi:F-type H+-transporting ATPase subunit delta
MTAGAAARRYARALFDVALAEGADLEGISRDLAGIGDLVAGNEALARVLSNPAIPAARKRGVMEQLVSRAGVGPLVARILLLLADRDRLVLVPDLVRQYRAKLLDHQRVVRAELTTAMPITDDRLAALQDGLAAATGRQVQLDVRVDPSIVGGAVARIGSLVYDGSVTRQLEKMKDQLVESGR